MNIQNYNNPNLARMPQRGNIQQNFQQPSFTGGEVGKLANEAGQKLKDEAPKALGPIKQWAAGFLTGFGEQAKNNKIFNILINSIGTAAIAPIMIIFNPFAKGEKTENKVYSALRQPVSAVLAIALQAPISAFIGGLCDKGCKNGNFGPSLFKEIIKDGKVVKELTSKGVGYSRIMTIVFSLFTLTPQVMALNYLYPKFVDMVAPAIKTVFKLDIVPKKKSAKTSPQSPQPESNPVSKNTKAEVIK